MNFLELVDEIEEMVETASQVPLTGKVMIDREELLSILTELKNEAPKEVAEADRITKQRDQILEDAKAEAEKMVELARSKAEEYINEDELVLRANERADEILTRANAESQQIREGARDYADELLENTQVNLSEIIKMLNENRQELRD